MSKRVGNKNWNAAYSQGAGAIGTIARTMAVPGESSPLRLPKFTCVERTAVMSYRHTGNFPVHENIQISAMLVRNPVAPLWIETPYSPDSNTPLVIAWQSHAVLGAVQAGSECTFPAKWASVSVGAGPATYDVMHKWILGTANGAHYVHAQSEGGTLVFETAMNNVTPGTFPFYFRYEVWDGNSFTIRTVTKTVTLPAGNAMLDVVLQERNVWVRPLSFAVNGAAVGEANLYNIRLGISQYVVSGLLDNGVFLNTDSISGMLSSPAQWKTDVSDWPNISIAEQIIWLMNPLVVSPEARTSYVPYTTVRNTATAVLFTNVTRVLEKEGTVSAVRVPAREEYNGYTIWTPNGYSDMAKSVIGRERFFGALEKGMYTYTLPDPTSDDFRTCVDLMLTSQYNSVLTPNNHQAKMLFDLLSFDYASCMFFEDLASGATQLAVTLDSHNEFRSASPLFQLGYSTFPLEVYHKAQIAMIKNGVFYENPTHLAVIGRLVLQAARSLAPVVAPYARAAAGAVGQHLLNAAATKLAGSLRQSAPGAAPQPRARPARRPKQVSKKAGRPKRRA